MVYLYENTFITSSDQTTQAVDLDHIQITTEPIHVNLLAFDQCGWSVRYLDSHSSLDSARAYLIRCYGDIRDTDRHNQPFVVEHSLPGCIGVVKPGRCHPLPLDLSIHYVYRHTSGLITSDTTQAQITRLSKLVQNNANDANLSLSGDIEVLIERMTHAMSRTKSDEEQLELSL